MTNRNLKRSSPFVLGLLALLPWVAQAQTPPTPVTAKAAAPWPPEHLEDGQPNVQGFWTAQVGGTYSLVNPRRGGGRLREQALEREGKKAPTRQSRVTDPPDGQIPYQAWARIKQKDIEANIDTPSQQKYIDPQARCFPDGVTRTLFWSGFEIQQFPGYVVLLFDGNHTYRAIPLDGRPHIASNIKLWMSDSRGHWAGNTLVVDVANSSSKHRLDNEGDFASDQVHIVERFTFTDANTFTYQSTFEDPTVYTKPWTIAAQFVRSHKNDPTWEQWESACHEGERNADNAFLGTAENSEPGKK